LYFALGSTVADTGELSALHRADQLAKFLRIYRLPFYETVAAAAGIATYSEQAGGFLWNFTTATAGVYNIKITRHIGGVRSRTHSRKPSRAQSSTK
jgi:hypothetical protein